jgi:hypothetical protein
MLKPHGILVPGQVSDSRRVNLSLHCRQQPTTVHPISSAVRHAHKIPHTPGPFGPRAQKIPTPPPRERSRSVRPSVAVVVPICSLYTGGAVNPSHPSHLTAAALVPFLPPSLSSPKNSVSALVEERKSVSSRLVQTRRPYLRARSPTRSLPPDCSRPTLLSATLGFFRRRAACRAEFIG